MSNEVMTTIEIDYLDALINIKRDHRKLQAKLKIYEDALEFYSSDGTYDYIDWDSHQMRIELDEGEIARQALGKVKDI